MRAIRMRTLVPVVLTLFAVAPDAGLAQETQDTTRLPESMRSARGTFQAAFRSLDPTPAAALFADSAVVDFQGQIFSGRVSITETFLPQAVQGLQSLRFGASSFTIGEEEVIENGSYYVAPADGSGEQAGSYRTTWRRQPDATWKVMRLDVLASG